MIEVHDDHLGVLRVGAATRVEESTESLAVESAQESGKISLIVECLNHLEVGLQLAITALFDVHGVHAGVVEVTDFLCIAPLDGVGVFDYFVDDVLEEEFVLQIDLGEGSV